MTNAVDHKLKTYVTLRMSKETIAKIDKLAEQNGRNRSQEIVFALRKYLENYEKDKERTTNKTEYPVIISPKVSPEVKEELLSLLYDKETIEKIKKISND